MRFRRGEDAGKSFLSQVSHLVLLSRSCFSNPKRAVSCLLLLVAVHDF